ncbi:MAG: UvrD-helicase domain-containing protein [Planctomycetota bacterium]
MDIPSPEEILAPLNEAQRTAAAQIEGPLLILAGPGSGKTRVITHRIAYMIAHDIPSHHIVALTFTNKAADEMKSRINKLAPGNRVWTSTFHRFCSRMLRRHAEMVGLKENFTIYDSGDSRKVVKQAIENSEVNLKHYSPDSLANEISNVKNKGITVEQFQPRPGHALDAILAKVYPEYQKLLQLANGVDFDDLLLYAVDLLRNAPELRQSLDEHFRYMMVDEYQDTNLAQYQLIRLLNFNYKNLAVTGDPDQSIYGWRGANINNILHFERDYENTSVVRLEQNYRSTQRILQVADQLIQNNTRRKKKSLITENEEGDQVRLVTYPSPQDEAIDIADSIALAVSQGKRTPGDFAILYRANYLSRALEHALRSVGLPYQIVNGHEFYQRKEIKDIMGYLHLLNNPSDNVAFERVINTPSRKIGKVTVGRLRRFAMDHGLPMLEAARRVDEIDTISKSPSSKIHAFVMMMDRLRTIPPDHVKPIIDGILEASGYREWLTLDGSEESFERAGNIDELIVAAEEFDRDHPEDGGLESYLEQASLRADTDVWDADSEFVTLMTLHAAKGLEFPSVFIVGLEDGILPHERSSADEEQVEEERRLLFVGITRAESLLQISRCQNRFRRGSYWPAIASRFLMELPRHEMQIFEPAEQSFGQDDIADMISDLSDWDELPSIDINEDEPDRQIQIYSSPDPDRQKGNDSVRESVDQLAAQLGQIVAKQKQPNTESLEGIPGLVTGAELASREKVFAAERLQPEQQRVGMRVEHPEYGIGVIVGITGADAKRTGTIEFDSVGEKSFRLAFVNLRLAE